MADKTIIMVQGHLSKDWMNYFEGLEIIYENDNTILTGQLKDQSHMYGVLNRLRDLNLKLISVNPAYNSHRNKF
jgi:hypothetical protein